jgi:diguanylate cyclase
MALGWGTAARMREGISPAQRIRLLGIVMVLATFGVVGHVRMVASDLDNMAITRQGNLILGELTTQTKALANQIQGATNWSDAVEKLHNTFEPSWAFDSVGGWFHRDFQHDFTVIVDGAQTPKQTVMGGALVSADTGRPYAAALKPQLDQLATSYARQAWSLRVDGQTAPLFTPLTETAFIAVRDQVALVAASVVIPDLTPAEPKAGPPTIVLSGRFLDRVLMNDIGERLHLNHVRYYVAPAPRLWPSVPINAPDGTAIGYVTWEPVLPGSTAIERNAPFVLVLMALLIVFVFINLRRLSRDSEALKSREAVARQMAYIDALSGLPNRLAFDRALRERLSVVRPDRPMALLYLDLDRFKEINDTHGHSAGDAAIRETARRLGELLGPEDLLARISGDEFAIILAPRAREADIAAACEAFVRAMSGVAQIENHQIPISISMGVAIAPQDGQEAGELIRRADIALFHAKSTARGTWHRFDDTMDDDMRRRQSIRRELATAIKHDQMELYYQPQVSADGRTVLGVEALVRWRHPTMGMVAPAYFIEVAEESGLIVELGAWVLRRACLDARRWPKLTVAVNVSPAQFRRDDFVEQVLRTVGQTGMDRSRLEIEITEGVLMANTDAAVKCLNRLREEGLRLALDDFGTGYSSLGYLRRFPFDKLKIDRSFVTSIEQSEDAAAIIHAIFGIAEALRMNVTVEGIETPGQHRFLQACGCHSLQGYLFSRPVPASEIDHLVERQSRGEPAFAQAV